MVQKMVGIRIKTLRNELGITQTELAERINVSNKTISKWEQGRGLPDVSVLHSLCEELDITIDELFSEEQLNKRKSKQYKSNRKRMIFDCNENLLTLTPEYSGLRISHNKFGAGIITDINGEQIRESTFLLWNVKYDSGLKTQTALPDMLAVGNIVPENDGDEVYIQKSKELMRLGFLMYKLQKDNDMEMAYPKKK